jgi:hypothetical protein
MLSRERFELEPNLVVFKPLDVVGCRIPYSYSLLRQVHI